MPSLLELIRKDAGFNKLKENVKDVGRGLARTPGNVAGSVVDITRMMFPATSKVGSSDWINEKLGIGETKTAAGKVTEVAAGFLDPALAVKSLPAAAGIIAAGNRAHNLDLGDVLRDVYLMQADGLKNTQISRESAKSVDKAGNPGGARSFFIGGEGKPRIVLDNAQAKLQNLDLLFKSEYAGPYAKHFNPTQFSEAVTGLVTKPDASTTLNQLLHFPGLYQLQPELRSMPVKSMDKLTEFLYRAKGSYNPATKDISLGSSYKFGQGGGGLHPAEDTLITLLHEVTHGIQDKAGFVGGSFPSAKMLYPQLLNAPQTPATKEFVKELEAMARVGKYDDKKLTKIYNNMYGEWEARASSEYGGNTFPIDYLPKKAWGNK